MIILVCGGRTFGDIATLREKFPLTYKNHPLWERRKAEYEFVLRTLDMAAIEFSRFYRANENWLPTDIKIVSGAASGADKAALDWAALNLAPWSDYPADWEKYGRAAGFIRNQEMLNKEQPNLVIAFPGHRGTADMIRRAKKAGIEIRKMARKCVITMKEDNDARPEF